MSRTSCWRRDPSWRAPRSIAAILHGEPARPLETVRIATDRRLRVRAHRRLPAHPHRRAPRSRRRAPWHAAASRRAEAASGRQMAPPDEQASRSRRRAPLDRPDADHHRRAAHRRTGHGVGHSQDRQGSTTGRTGSNDCLSSAGAQGQTVTGAARRRRRLRGRQPCVLPRRRSTVAPENPSPTTWPAHEAPQPSPNPAARPPAQPRDPRPAGSPASSILVSSRSDSVTPMCRSRWTPTRTSTWTCRR